MKLLRFLFKGLRGKLTLTYTLVTVLALMALETVLMIAMAAYSEATNTDSYMGDVVSTLVPEARSYLQPEQDLPGLQVWLTTLSRKGYASLEPQNLFDSPAAAIVPNSPIYILSPGGEVIARNDSADGVEFVSVSQQVLDSAYAGDKYIDDLYMIDGNGNYWIAVPIFQKDHDDPVLGVITLTVEPLPARDLIDWIYLLGMVMMAGVIMTLALAPFGTLFGFAVSRGFTRRLSDLSKAAEAWGRGDFSVMPPVERGNDEISALGIQMREMARKINGLMEDRQSLAQIQERNRIAQELHDTVKQQSFATLMQVRAARNVLSSDPGQAMKSLVEAEKLIKDSQQELALMISELRPPALEGKGLFEALREYIDSWSKHACIPASFMVNDEKPLPFEVESTLYRITQEGLSNIARHSRASACRVMLYCEEDQVKMQIIDNGTGFDLSEYQASGFGLTGMQDRLEKVNGRLEIRTGADTGTQLTVIVPLPPVPKDTGKKKND